LLGGEPTTVREFVRGQLPLARVLSTTEFASDSQRYDFVLCANVLPVIPNRHMRAEALRSLSEHMSKLGRCLFVCQYRNSYFTNIPNVRGAKAHMNGWVVLREADASSYFGILPREQLQRIVSRSGFHVLRSWIFGQSVYVLCGQGSGNGQDGPALCGRVRARSAPTTPSLP
jgi:hypothetical protein